MNRASLQSAILRAASLLAPGEQRDEWLAGWRSELWYIPRRGSTLFCLGAFQDALWLRRNNPSPQHRTDSIHLESPFVCLALMAILAAASLFLAIQLPAPETMPHSSQLRFRDLLEGCVGMQLLSSLALPAIRLAMGPGAHRYPLPWRSRLRRGIFLALKIALIQPIMFGGFVVVCAMPIANLAFNASWILAFRWVLIDQRRRCPVCLRLLTEPVRIGSASQTFLEWYGVESTCSRGHGMLQTSEVPASYSGKPEWLALDDSWKSLFSEAAGARQP
jgi:hypothetical protein